MSLFQKCDSTDSTKNKLRCKVSYLGTRNFVHIENSDDLQFIDCTELDKTILNRALNYVNTFVSIR